MSSELYNIEYNEIHKLIRKFGDRYFYKAVKAFRNIGWTDKQIADALDIDQSVISRKFGKGRGK